MSNVSKKDLERISELVEEIALKLFINNCPIHTSSIIAKDTAKKAWNNAIIFGEEIERILETLE